MIDRTLYNFHQSCYRYKQFIKPDPKEIHPCFFCGCNLSLVTDMECAVCGIMVCSSCRHCLCTISNLQYITLIEIHKKYCCHLDQFEGYIDLKIPFDRDLAEICEQVLKNCYLLEFNKEATT